MITISKGKVMIHAVPRDGSLPIEVMLHGKTVKQTSMSVDLNDTVLSLKTRISICESFPIVKLQLFLGDQQLEDHKQLSDYQVRKMITIHVNIVADEAESIQRPSLELYSTDFPMCTGSPESKGACGTGPYVSRSGKFVYIGLFIYAVTLQISLSKWERVVLGLMLARSGKFVIIYRLIYLCRHPPEQMGACGIGPCATNTGMFIRLAHTKDNYVNTANTACVRSAGVTKTRQLTIETLCMLWKNNTVSPTYRSLINILLYLKEVEVARSICFFLHVKDIS